MKGLTHNCKKPFLCSCMVDELAEKTSDRMMEIVKKHFEKWIDRNDELPDYGEEVEVSFDGGKTKECDAQFSENCTCMMAGIAGGYGYFTNEFATIDDNLVLHDVTHWRKTK